MNQALLPVAEITSYWGAKCTYTFSTSVRVDVPLTSGILQILEVCPHYISHFKIQLRALESASEQEIRTMVKLAGLEEGGAIRQDEEGITYETSNESIRITYQGGIYHARKDGKSGNALVAPVVDYARRAGIFWPRTLSEEFVEILK